MYTKQDSIFWWNFDQYIQHDHKKIKNLSANKKSFIENSFHVAYYGIMQYQLYKGRQIQSIEASNLDQLVNYIDDNLENLVNNYLIKHKNKRNILKDKQEFLHLLVELILPYINDNSFETLQDFRINEENIVGFIMQLAIKYQYDINVLNNEQVPEKPFYSQIYPFMVSLMILNPTKPMNIFENIKKFFVPEILLENYHNGRSLSDEEIEFLAPQIDLLKNQEDFESFIYNFTKENWFKSDLQTRFKLVYQLSKFSAILLKDNIYSLTYLENENEVYELIQFYLPIILRSVEELKEYRKDIKLNQEQTNDKICRFLRPWTIKDFDPRWIVKYIKKQKIYDLNFELKKLYKMMDITIYVSSYIRLIELLGQDSLLLQRILIDKKSLALVKTLKIFRLNGNHYEQIQNYQFSLNEEFLDSTTLKKLESLKISNLFKNNLKTTKTNNLVEKLNDILILFSYILSLDPKRVKDFSYSLDEFVKYYLILFGPYLKTKIGYQTNDFFLLTKKIIEMVTYFEKNVITLKSNEKQLIKNGYYLKIYLIEKLLEFSKKDK